MGRARQMTKLIIGRPGIARADAGLLLLGLDLRLSRPRARWPPAHAWHIETAWVGSPRGIMVT